MTTTTRAALGIGKPRRIRSDAKLARLSAAQRERLRVWLGDENRTYADVVVRVREDFGLSVGKSALGVYYRRHVLAEQEDVDTQAARFLAALPEGELSPAILHRAKALAFSALCRPQPLIRLATRLRDVVYRSEKRRLARARLALAERRAALRAILPSRSTPRPHLAEAPQTGEGTVPNLARSLRRRRIIPFAKNITKSSSISGLSRPHPTFQAHPRSPRQLPPPRPWTPPASPYPPPPIRSLRLLPLHLTPPTKKSSRNAPRFPG